MERARDQRSRPLQLVEEIHERFAARWPQPRSGVFASRSVTGTSIVLEPPAADPAITDEERRPIAEMMAKGATATIFLHRRPSSTDDCQHLRGADRAPHRVRAVDIRTSRYKPDNPGQTHDFRSDHDRLFHPGNQDLAASRV
jgi:hypothetical protein